MSLIDLKNHMMQVKIATLNHLAIQFNADPELIRSKLTHWIRKGKIRKCMKKPACQTQCFICPSSLTEIYEWVYN